MAAKPAVRGFHHVAYRCKDAKETVDFYKKYLDLDFNIAVAENKVPSTGEFSPHIHIFLQLPDGSFVAFFELPEDKGNMLDLETPAWVQHLAFKVDDMDALNAFKAKLEADGIKVLGPTDHGLCQSIYFRDPSGHRLEFAVDTLTPKQAQDLRDSAPALLAEWSRTKRAPDKAAH